MSDLFSTIGNAIGGLFGIPQGQAAQKANNQAQQQQQLQNQYGQQASNVYSGLQQQGHAQIGAQNQNFLTLLDRYGSIAGLGNPLSFGQQGHPGDSGGRTPTPGTPGQNPQATRTDPSLDPYALDGNQQAQLNQSMGQIANAQKSAAAQFTQQMAASGITDPRALQLGQEQLQEHFATLQADTQTKFYEQVKQDKLTALQQIISQIGQYGQQGVQETEAAGSGFLGLASGAQSALTNQQQLALQQQQSSQGAIGGLLNLGGFAAGGGFNRTTTSTPQTGALGDGTYPSY